MVYSEMIANNTIDFDNRMVDAPAGSEIRKKRSEQGISRIRAAAYCGVSETTFTKWEYGVNKKIKQKYYDKLIEVMNGTAKFDG